MIRYVSSFSVNTLHGMVNDGLLQMLCMAFPEQDIEIAATASTLDRFRAIAAGYDNRFTYRRLRVNNRPGRIPLLLRYLQSATRNIAALARSRRGDTLLYNFNNVFSLSAVNFLSRTLFRHRQIYTVCHGEMEYLANADKHTRKYKKLMAWLTDSFFRKTSSRRLSPHMHFIVLGDIIVDELAACLPPHMHRRFSSVDHPVLPSANDHAGDASTTPADTVNVGTVGIMNRYKGAGTLLQIARNLDNPRVRLGIVGHIQSDYDEFRRLGIVTAGASPRDALDQHEFDRRVAELDYILLLYPSDSYRLIASGALLDTIRYRKPLIAITNPYFRYIFDKYGSTGRLFDDADTLTAHLNTLKPLSPEKDSTDATPGPLTQNTPDYDDILQRLSPEALAPRLRAILTHP